MLAKVLLLCASVAAIRATALYGPGLLHSGIVAPGLLNTVVAPAINTYKGSPYLSAPLAYTSKSVVAAAPVAYTTYAARPVIAAPVAYSAPIAYAARPVIAAPVAYSAPIAYAARPVLAAPASITTHRTVVGATSLLTGTPLVYGSGLYGAAPYALNTRIVSPIGLKGGLLAGAILK